MSWLRVYIKNKHLNSVNAINSVNFNSVFIGKSKSNFHKLNIYITMSVSVHPSLNLHPKKLDFAYSFEPIYYFSRLFGLMPFKIVRNTNGEIQISPKVNRLDRLWFVVSICLYLYLVHILGQYIMFAKNMTRQQAILFIGDQLRLIFCLFFATLAIGADMRNRFKLVAILKKIIIIDKDVSDRMRNI